MRALVMSESMLAYLLRESTLKMPLPLRLALLAAEAGGTFDGGADGVRDELGAYVGVTPWRESSLDKGVKLGVEFGFLTPESSLNHFTARPEVVQLVELECEAA